MTDTSSLNSSKKSRCKKTSEKLMSIDQFAQGFDMSLDKKGNAVKHSLTGTILTTILGITLLIYLI